MTRHNNVASEPRLLYANFQLQVCAFSIARSVRQHQGHASSQR
jgi:hypothetical protein